MIVKDNLTVFPFTTPKRFFIYPDEISIGENLTALNTLVVTMSIYNTRRGTDVFVFKVSGGNYLKLLSFESFGPLVITLAQTKTKEVLKGLR